MPPAATMLMIHAISPFYGTAIDAEAANMLQLVTGADLGVQNEMIVTIGGVAAFLGKTVEEVAATALGAGFRVQPRQQELWEPGMSYHMTSGVSKDEATGAIFIRRRGAGVKFTRLGLFNLIMADISLAGTQRRDLVFFTLGRVRAFYALGYNHVHIESPQNSAILAYMARIIDCGRFES